MTLLEVLQEMGVVLKIPHFSSRVQIKWGSGEENYRHNIRRGICEAMTVRQELSLEGEHNLMDLKNLPRLTDYEISISHSEELGGFVMGYQCGLLGFDLEGVNRVKEEHIKRVSTCQEVSEAPSAGALWVAKEAAYKALRHKLHLSLMSDLQISHWQFQGKFCRYLVVAVKGERQVSPLGEGLVLAPVMAEKINSELSVFHHSP